MRVAVAGGSGFVGRHVVAALLAAGHDVRVLARGTRAAPPGADAMTCDVAAGPLPPGALADCQAVVNLVGIKREEGAQTFELAHVAATRYLRDAAEQADARRFVQVSVVASRPDPRLPYHDTKWRAEELVRASGLAWTILRPGVICGRGDDLLTHLVQMIRFAPVFPVVGDGRAPLQPVDVQTVAAAVVAALGREQAVGQSYVLVGPAPLPLRAVVRTVARGLGLPLWIVPVPVAVQRVAVRLMNAVTPRPLATPAQLQMLVDGLAGNPEPAKTELGVESPPFTEAVVGELAADVPPLFGLSLHLRAGAVQAAWLAKRRGAFGGAVALAVAAMALLWLLAALVPNVWYRMAAFYALLVPVALVGQRVGWCALWRPSRAAVAGGVVAAAALYALGWAVFHLLAVAVPPLGAQLAPLYAWADDLPAPPLGPLLFGFIVAGEEIVWRGAIALPFAARWGPWRGVLAGALVFGAAHAGFGSPLLVLAALGCGAYWGWLAILARGLVPALVSHILWDLAVMFWLPY
ncbi:MAG TPA: NAD(P)H-binding protein [Chloroflexota bacterium]|jgi:NADH dehydrogenase